MGIDGLKRTIGNAINGVKDAAVKTVKDEARAVMLANRGVEIQAKLASLKGWGPETAAQRKALTAELNGINAEIKQLSLGNKMHDAQMNALRNLR